MRLSKQTNYAVRTLVYCAVHAPELSRVADIAKVFGISDMFLFKIIFPITKNGESGGAKLVHGSGGIVPLRAV
ncbi:MAG: hypothetical protein CMJ15_04380 [Pelagibacterium sp.]|nr:hypothetical protein [Pelagibacterium sp.]